MQLCACCLQDIAAAAVGVVEAKRPPSSECLMISGCARVVGGCGLEQGKSV